MAIDEAALSKRSAWFQKFKNGEYDVEGRKCTKKEDSCQMQEQLVLTLEVT